MLLLNKNKISAFQIAKSFCKDKGGSLECTRELIKRLNFFNDNNFTKSFLPAIGSSRFFVFVMSVTPINRYEGDVYLDGYEIVTKKNKSIQVRVRYDQIKFNSVLKVLNLKVGAPYYFTIGKFGDYFIVRLDGTGNDYPQSVKSFVPVIPERIIPDPPESPESPSDPGSQQGPVTAGFDLEGIFSNPVVLIGGAALLFFYLMKD